MASAVAAALNDLYGETAHVELVDPLAEYVPWPLNRLGSAHPHVVGLGGVLWALGWHLSDGPRRIILPARAWWLVVRASVLRFLREHPPDAIVCCHPLFSYPIRRALDETGTTPLITLVTDPIAAHAFWFVPRVTRCL